MTKRGPRPYNIDRSKWRKCEHPRTPENTYSHSGHEQCRTCRDNAPSRIKDYHHGARKSPPSRVRPWLVLPPLPLPPTDHSTGREHSQFFPRKLA